MPNLIELAKDVEILMQQFGDIGAERQRLQVLNTRSKMIEEICSRINEVNEGITVLATTNVPTGQRPKASDALLKKCEKVRADFEKDWEKTIRDNSIASHFIEPAKKHVTEAVLGTLKADWRTYVDKEAPQITKDSLDALRQAGVDKAVGEIQGYLGELNDLRKELPNDKAAVEHVKEISKKAIELFDQIDEIPEDVRKFLSKATKGNALIPDLSDEIRAWLAEHDMLEKLRIQFHQAT